MDLQSFLDELSVSDSHIPGSKLVHLSDLGPEELHTFTEGWLSIPSETRRKAMSMMTELTEENIDLNFSAIFRYCLDDEEEDVRKTAITGLWDCEDRSLISPLIRLLNDDSDENVRAAAAQALGRFALLGETGKLLERDVNRVSDALLGAIDNEDGTLVVRRRAIEAVATLSVERVPELINDAYAVDDPLLKASALYAMGATCDPEWLPILLRELRSDDAQMRYEAVGALGEIGEEEAVPHLVPLMFDTDSQVQATAVNVLGSIGGPIAKAALAQAAKNPDARLSEMAADALETIGVDEDPATVGMLRSQRPVSRVAQAEEDEDEDEEDEE